MTNAKLPGRPLILTALGGARTFSRFETLRRAHYPATQNIVPAHLTLFRHLPGTEIAEISRRLKVVAAGAQPMAARAIGLRNLGEGVAFRVVAPELEDLRAGLAEAFAYWLTPQDVHFWPHVTIQNKVSARIAKALFEELSAGFTAWRFEIVGLSLWQYLDGPWEKLRDFRFRG